VIITIATYIIISSYHASYLFEIKIKVIYRVTEGKGEDGKTT